MNAGQGALAIARGRGRSVVTRASARSPLRLLVPRNHGDAVWAFQSSLGGGLVDGDQVDLAVEVGAGAAALLGTQASTKVYRSPRGCAQRIRARVDDGGLLVVLPDPVVPYAGARLAQSIEVDLDGDASLLLVDALTAGRAARGERWAFARVTSAITVRRAGRLLLHDAIELDPAEGDLAARMAGFDAVATIVAIGPRVGLDAAPPPARGAGWIAARSPIEGGALLRGAARRADLLHAGVRAALRALPALLGDDPFARKY